MPLSEELSSTNNTNWEISQAPKFESIVPISNYIGHVNLSDGPDGLYKISIRYEVDYIFPYSSSSFKLYYRQTNGELLEVDKFIDASRGLTGNIESVAEEYYGEVHFQYRGSFLGSIENVELISVRGYINGSPIDILPGSLSAYHIDTKQLKLYDSSSVDVLHSSYAEKIIFADGEYYLSDFYNITSQQYELGFGSVFNVDGSAISSLLNFSNPSVKVDIVGSGKSSNKLNVTSSNAVFEGQVKDVIHVDFSGYGQRGVFNESVSALVIDTSAQSDVYFNQDVSVDKLNINSKSNIYLADGVAVTSLEGHSTLNELFDYGVPYFSDLKQQLEKLGYDFGTSFPSMRDPLNTRIGEPFLYKALNQESRINVATDGTGTIEFLGDGALGIDVGTSEKKIGKFIVNGDVDLAANIHAHELIINELGGINIKEDLTLDTTVIVEGDLDIGNYHVDGINKLYMDENSEISVVVSEQDKGVSVSGNVLILEDGATINLDFAQGVSDVQAGDEFLIFDFDAVDVSDSVVIEEAFDHLEFSVKVNDEGDLSVQAGAADGYVLGSNTQDVLYHFNHNTKLLGFGDDDILISFGNSGVIDGGDGNDIIISYGKGNRIVGGNGNDYILGNATSGVTEIIGGKGSDVVVGGTSEDHFIYTNLDDSIAGQFDMIMQFDTQRDFLDLSALGINEEDIVVSYHDDGVSRVGINGSDFELWILTNQGAELSDWNII